MLKKNLCLLALAVTLLPCIPIKGQTVAGIVVERNVSMQTRDGVTLREYRFRFFEHATVATVTVYDRAGARLGTVYLAFAPEPGQQQMTERLTAPLVPRRWTSAAATSCALA